MDLQRNSSIITGSDINHRTFGEEESWNSLQSTVLAGNITINNTTSDIETRKHLTTVDETNLSKDDVNCIDIETRQNLTTVDEETQSKDDVDCTQYEDILNMNIDAIGSDDEAFFDCPSFLPKYSPMKSKSSTLSANFKYSPKYSPMKYKPSSSNRSNLKYGTFLTITNSSTEVNQTSTFDSGVDERTGSLLAQIVDDFNKIRREAQSTPNLEKESEHSSILNSPLEEENRRHEKNRGSNRKLSFAIEDPVKQKVSKAKDKKSTNSPVEWKPARRVAKMKEFFENKSKIAEESRNNPTSRTSSFIKKSLIPKLSTSSSKSFSNNTRNVPKFVKAPLRSKSPTYKIRSVPKLVVTPARRLTATPANKSGSRLLRPSSCSEYSSESSENNYSHQTSRSHSTSEIEYNRSESLNSTKFNSNKRPYFITNRKATLHRKSPKSQSTISKRRSVGIAAKSPIKPVRELRKVYSPSYQNKYYQ